MLVCMKYLGLHVYEIKLCVHLYVDVYSQFALRCEGQNILCVLGMLAYLSLL